MNIPSGVSCCPQWQKTFGTSMVGRHRLLSSPVIAWPYRGFAQPVTIHLTFKKCIRLVDRVRHLVYICLSISHVFPSLTP